MNDKRLSPRVLSSIANNKIVAPLNLELIVADHCNIACRQCNHASPIVKKWNASVEETQRTLTLLADVFHCKTLRILGGEPLLNPNLVDIILIAKQSGIGDAVQLTTNGMLLDRLSDEGWTALDEIEISLYETSKLTEAKIDAFKRKGKQFHTRVNVSKYPNFRMTFSSQTSDNTALVEDIWQACKMANVWGCYSLRDGTLYRCPQSIYISEFADGNFGDEGFKLAGRAQLQDDLLAFLNAPGPLKSCRNCVGSSGKKIEQTDLTRRTWKTDLDKPLEDMVDFGLLEQAKKESNIIDDCRTPLRKKRILSKLAKKIRSFSV